MTAVALVVLGCDGAPDSDAAVRFAAEEARLRHARLVVVAAYERPIDPDLDDFDIPDAELSARARVGCEAALRRALDTPAGGGPTRSPATSWRCTVCRRPRGVPRL